MGWDTGLRGKDIDWEGMRQMRQRTIMTEWHEHMWENRGRMKEESNRQPMHEAAPTLPPSSAGQRDQCKWDRLISNTQTQSRVTICLWQTRPCARMAMCAHAKTHTHEDTHTLRREEQTEMKGINRLEADIWRVQCTPERINRNWSRQTAKGQQQ